MGLEGANENPNIRVPVPTPVRDPAAIPVAVPVGGPRTGALAVEGTVIKELDARGAASVFIIGEEEVILVKLGDEGAIKGDGDGVGNGDDDEVFEAREEEEAETCNELRDLDNCLAPLFTDIEQTKRKIEIENEKRVKDESIRKENVDLVRKEDDFSKAYQISPPCHIGGCIQS